MTTISCERVTSCYARALTRNYLKRAEIRMPEESPLVRQWLLLKALCARRHGVSAREMVEEMGVSDKTIRRDLETFERAGFPLEEMVGEFGRKRWRIDQAKTQPDLAFSFDEAIALYLGRRLMEPLAATLFWNAPSKYSFKTAGPRDS